MYNISHECLWIFPIHLIFFPAAFPFLSLSSTKTAHIFVASMVDFVKPVIIIIKAPPILLIGIMIILLL